MGHVPAQEHGAARGRRIVAPVGVLGPHGEDAPHAVRGLGQPDHEAPGGVADHVDRLAGESPGNVLQHTLEIVLPPVDPVGLEPTQPTVSRFADAAVVVGHHVPSVAVEPVGKARVVPAAHRGGRVDDRDRMRASWIAGAAPGESTQGIAVGGANVDGLSHY